MDRVIEAFEAVREAAARTRDAFQQFFDTYPPMDEEEEDQ